jgi:hypothetical protein
VPPYAVALNITTIEGKGAALYGLFILVSELTNLIKLVSGLTNLIK